MVGSCTTSSKPICIPRPTLHSAALGYPETIKAVVIDGALQHNGMVSFAAALRPDDAEAIRQYLIKRANEDKALEGRK